MVLGVGAQVLTPPTKNGVCRLRACHLWDVRMSMRVPESALMLMRVSVRDKLHSVAFFETSEFPNRHGERPGQKKHADDEVAEYAEVQARHKSKSGPWQTPRMPTNTCSNSIVPMTIATATDRPVVVML